MTFDAMKSQLNKLVIALILGVAVGGVGMWLSLRRVIAQQVIDCSAGNVVVAVNRLTLARQGDYERLIEEGESELSVILLGLIPAERYLSESQMKMLVVANRYYQRYPASVGDTDYDAEIRAFLQRVSNSRPAPKAQTTE